MPEQKDVMSAILGASVSIAGLLLVFSGFLFAQAAVLPSTTSDRTINKFRTGGKVGMIPFLISLFVAGGSLTWLLQPIPCVYHVVSIGFFILLFATALYGAITILWFL